MITEETRLESYNKIIPKQPVRYDQIIYILRNNPEGLTAKEIAVKLYELKLIPSTERNFVSPRLTELLKKGKVQTIGKRVCKYSERLQYLKLLNKSHQRGENNEQKIKFKNNRNGISIFH